MDAKDQPTIRYRKGLKPPSPLPVFAGVEFRIDESVPEGDIYVVDCSVRPDKITDGVAVFRFAPPAAPREE